MKSSKKLFSMAAATLAFATVFSATSAQAQPGDFDQLTDSPTSLTGVTSSADNTLIYAQQFGGTSFYSYDPATDTWTPLTASPISADDAGAAVAGGDVYVSYTNSSQLGVYDIVTNTWTQIANPVGGETANIASDGGTLLYILDENEFVSYDVTTMTTVPLDSPPFEFSDQGGLEYYDGFLYAHEGDGANRFARYDIANDEWTVLPNVPSTGAVLGSAIDPVNGFYYAYGDYNENNLYIYNIATNRWTTVDIPYFDVEDGGLAFSTAGGVPAIYFVEGQDGVELARFEAIPGVNVDGNSNFIGNAVGSGTAFGFNQNQQSGQVKASFSVANTYNNGLTGNLSWTDKSYPLQLGNVQLISIAETFNGSRSVTITGTATVNGSSDRYLFTFTATDQNPFFINRGDTISLSVPEFGYEWSGQYNPGDVRISANQNQPSQASR